MLLMPMRTEVSIGVGSVARVALRGEDKVKIYEESACEESNCLKKGG